MREDAKEFYENILKKLKVKIGETYNCNLKLKNIFNEEKQIDCYAFELLSDSYDLSPMINLSFFDNGNIYFAEPNLILDKYDKDGIIYTLDNVKLSNTYYLGLLKDFIKILNKEKEEK